MQLVGETSLLSTELKIMVSIEFFLLEALTDKTQAALPSSLKTPLLTNFGVRIHSQNSTTPKNLLVVGVTNALHM